MTLAIVIIVAMALLSGTALVALRLAAPLLEQLPPPAPPCAHSWTIVAKTIVKSTRVREMDLPYLTTKQFEETRGSTHLIMTCDSCGAVKETTVPGEPQ